MRAEHLIAVSLAICTLLIGVPARQHSHVAGDRPHSHGHAQSPGPAHCHEHEHENEHNGVGQSFAHVHVTFFGVDFTLPAESDDDENHEGRCTFLGPAPTAIELDQSTSQFSVPAELALDGGEPLRIVPTFRSIAASAAPLCDTARHESSGVLLI